MTSANDPANELEELEIRLLLEGIYQHYGYDFRNYAAPTLRRRIRDRVRREQLATVSGLLEQILHDKACLYRLVSDLTVSVTTMFRDPMFFAALRDQVMTMLQTYPFIRVWHAGCATGEEVYSLAILLHEAGLLARCQIYATDMSTAALDRGRQGVYSQDKLQEYVQGYVAAGGKTHLSEYYTAGYGNIVFRSWLKKHMLFARHNLVTDGPFNEFNLILCRNVLIYFDPALQKRVLGLLYDSLVIFGYLGLGRSGTIRASPYVSRFEPLNEAEKIFRKIR